MRNLRINFRAWKPYFNRIIASRSGFSLLWILAATLALALGVGLSWWVITTFRTSQTILFFISGLFGLTPLYICQWLLLRYYRKATVWWIGASIAATLIYIIFVLLLINVSRANFPLIQVQFQFGLPIFTVVVFVSGSIFGLLLGGFQWLVLRRIVPLAAWWIPANVLSFGAGIALGNDISRFIRVAYFTAADKVSSTTLLLQTIATNSIGALVICVIAMGILIYLLQYAEQ